MAARPSRGHRAVFHPSTISPLSIPGAYRTTTPRRQRHKHLMPDLSATKTRGANKIPPLRPLAQLSPPSTPAGQAGVCGRRITRPLLTHGWHEMAVWACIPWPGGLSGMYPRRLDPAHRRTSVHPGIAAHRASRCAWRFVRSLCFFAGRSHSQDMMNLGPRCSTVHIETRASRNVFLWTRSPRALAFVPASPAHSPIIPRVHLVPPSTWITRAAGSCLQLGTTTVTLQWQFARQVARSRRSCRSK